MVNLSADASLQIFNFPFSKFKCGFAGGNSKELGSTNIRFPPRMNTDEHPPVQEIPQVAGKRMNTVL